MQDVASVNLTDQYQLTAAGMVPHILIWPSDHDGAINWLICHNFSNVVLADRLQPHMDHLQCIRLMHARMISKM